MTRPPRPARLLVAVLLLAATLTATSGGVAKAVMGSPQAVVPPASAEIRLDCCRRRWSRWRRSRTRAQNGLRLDVPVAFQLDAYAAFRAGGDDRNGKLP